MHLVCTRLYVGSCLIVSNQFQLNRVLWYCNSIYCIR